MPPGSKLKEPVPQNTPEKTPIGFGRAVLVSIQQTLLPMVRRMLGKWDDDVMRAILSKLEMSEMIEWNQVIWVPENFGQFLENVVYGPDSVEQLYVMHANYKIGKRRIVTRFATV